MKAAGVVYESATGEVSLLFAPESGYIEENGTKFLKLHKDILDHIPGEIKYRRRMMKVTIARVTEPLVNTRTREIPRIWSKIENIDVPSFAVDQVSIVLYGDRNFNEEIARKDLALGKTNSPFSFEEFLAKIRSHKEYSKAFAHGTVSSAKAKSHPAGRSNQNEGGIDFDDLNLVVRKDPNGFPLPLAMQDAELVQIDGLTPVILRVAAVSEQEIHALLHARDLDSDFKEKPLDQLSYSSP
jgi:hypothetical protein